MAERLLMVYLSVSGTSPAAGAFCQDNASTVARLSMNTAHSARTRPADRTTSNPFSLVVRSSLTPSSWKHLTPEPAGMDDGGRGKPVDISCPVVTYSRLVCDSLLSDRNLCVFRNLSAKVTFRIVATFTLLFRGSRSHRVSLQAFAVTKKF
jgi:hypothetical protein